jgi:hypothetical protein
MRVPVLNTAPQHATLAITLLCIHAIAQLLATYAWALYLTVCCVHVYTSNCANINTQMNRALALMMMQ